MTIRYTTCIIKKTQDIFKYYIAKILKVDYQSKIIHSKDIHVKSSFILVKI